MTDGTMQWRYEECSIPLAPTGMLLVRVLVAKIANIERLITIIRKVSVIQKDPEWNCVLWVKEALQMIRADSRAVGTATLDWNAVRDAAVSYHEQKAAEHRFDGKAKFDQSRAATFDLLEGRETIP